jgi:hypothetical protein
VSAVHDAHECQACGAAGELRSVTSHSLADGAERTEWFCADTAACNDRLFPELARILRAFKTNAEAARDEPEIGR